jgi:hypothetical protein
LAAAERAENISGSRRFVVFLWMGSAMRTHGQMEIAYSAAQFSDLCAAAPGGQHSYILPHPELYNIDDDPDESYDMAPDNPQIVAQIEAKVRELIPGFPREVQEAYAAEEARKADPSTPTGAWPRPAKVPEEQGAHHE